MPVLRRPAHRSPGRVGGAGIGAGREDDAGTYRLAGGGPARARASSFVAPARSSAPVKPMTPVGRGGLVRLPDRPERGFLGSLRYPLWDGVGLFVLAVGPLVLGPLSLAILGLLVVLSRGGLFVGGTLSLLSITFGGILGFVLLFLGNVMTTSAQGEVIHPRWPEWDPHELALGGIVRWAWVVGTGLLLLGWPIGMYWSRVASRPMPPGGVTNLDKLHPLDGLIFGAGLTPPLVYALLALLAWLLFEDWRAANPWTVLRAAWTLGGRLIGPVLLTGFAAVVTCTAAIALYLRAIPGVMIVGGWLLWVLDLYVAMVVLRALGVAYNRRASVLGWFPERERWGR